MRPGAWPPSFYLGTTDMRHDFYTVIGTELVACDVCNCAEGTLPTDCPGVLVPERVQTLIHKGVVDFDGGRWVGGRLPQRKFAPVMREAVEGLRRLGEAARAVGFTPTNGS